MPHPAASYTSAVQPRMNDSHAWVVCRSTAISCMALCGRGGAPSRLRRATWSEMWCCRGRCRRRSSCPIGSARCAPSILARCVLVVTDIIAAGHQHMNECKCHHAAEYVDMHAAVSCVDSQHLIVLRMYRAAGPRGERPQRNRAAVPNGSYCCRHIVRRRQQLAAWWQRRVRSAAIRGAHLPGESGFSRRINIECDSSIVCRGSIILRRISTASWRLQAELPKCS